MTIECNSKVALKELPNMLMGANILGNDAIVMLIIEETVFIKMFMLY